ncbi:MAG TPA: glutamate-cysteine ligase family protein [Gemmatimonadales bacterium]|nr:glutamate-cysteine ligase family protein [Gemmatimonadales bacterium]
MTGLSVASLREDLLINAFGGTGSAYRQQIGVEWEFIPVEASTGRRCPIEGDGLPATLPFLRFWGSRQSWIEGRTPKGTPCFSLPSGGSLTFEPGGQLEYSTPPCRSVTSLLGLLRTVVVPLRAAAADEGIELLTYGIDPLNPIESAPLLVDAKRYSLMADHFATVGPAGAKMMRQTASFQINLNFDDEPQLRWRVLNAAAPHIIAMFANSPIYDGSPTGHQSTRAAVWREVDPARTGLPFDDHQPVDAYLDFALAAPAILLPPVRGERRPFGEWLAQSNPTLEEWHDHLSTLFPEVRPRGHLELRSCDALPARWCAAPLALTAGLLYDTSALRAADDLLGAPQPTLLERAARDGLHDPYLARTAVDLCEIALSGCRRLGPAYFHPADLELATTYFDRYTRRGRAPADDIMEKALAA